MRLTDWQQQPSLLKAAQDLLDRNETFQQMMQMASEESPANLPTSIAVTEAEHSRRLGYIEGYHHCLRVFHASCKKPVRIKEVEARFETPKD